MMCDNLTLPRHELCLQFLNHLISSSSLRKRINAEQRLLSQLFCCQLLNWYNDDVFVRPAAHLKEIRMRCVQLGYLSKDENHAQKLRSSNQ